MTETDNAATEKLELIMGREGLARLAASTVMVLGVGGVGSNCVEALARGGVGRLVVVDHDVVQASNINRQAIAFRSTIGRKKVDVARAMVADINPSAQVEALDRFVLAEDVPDFLGAYAGRVDFFIDAIDTISAKLAVAQYADAEGLRLISSMGAANKLRPDCFRFADVYGTVNCPLCRITVSYTHLDVYKRQPAGHMRYDGRTPPSHERTRALSASQAPPRRCRLANSRRRW